MCPHRPHTVVVDHLNMSEIDILMKQKESAQEKDGDGVGQEREVASQSQG